MLWEKFRKLCHRLIPEDILENKHWGIPWGKKSIGEWSSPKYMTCWTNYLTFDIMGDLCFSRSMDMLDSPENHYMLEVLRRVFKGSILCVGNTEPCAAALQLDKIILRDLVKANARYEAFSKRQADERIAKGDKVDTKDVLYFLQKAKDPYTGEGYTLHELVAEASLLVLRGKSYFAASFAGRRFFVPNRAMLSFWNRMEMVPGLA